MRSQTDSRVCLQTLRAVLQPRGQVSGFAADGIESGVVSRPVFPIEFVHGKNMMRVESAAVKLPERERSTGSPISIGKRMNGLKLMVDYPFAAMESKVPARRHFECVRARQQSSRPGREAPASR